MTNSKIAVLGEKLGSQCRKASRIPEAANGNITAVTKDCPHLPASMVVVDAPSFYSFPTDSASVPLLSEQGIELLSRNPIKTLSHLILLPTRMLHNPPLVGGETVSAYSSGYCASAYPAGTLQPVFLAAISTKIGQVFRLLATTTSFHLL